MPRDEKTKKAQRRQTRNSQADPEFDKDSQFTIEVHQAQDIATKKVIGWLNRIQREAQSTSRISSENIVGLYEANNELQATEETANEAIIRFANAWLE